MNNFRIEIIDKFLTEDFILHRRHQKYWQARFEESQQKVFVECGRLLANDQKDTKTIICLEKKVPDRTEAKKYMERCINTKLIKDYKFLRPQKPPQEIKEPLSLPSILDKRPNPNEQEILKQAGETSKKLHSSSTSSGLKPQLQAKTKMSPGTKQSFCIVIDDEDEEIEEIFEGNGEILTGREQRNLIRNVLKMVEDN